MPHFILVDCNNFYASCERLFNPKLEGRPIIVLSNNDGCVVARSQEAKQLGIKMGEPYFKIKTFCFYYHVAVYSSNYALYGNLSQRVMTILAQMAPEIEVYSIDEAFLTYPSSMDSNVILEQGKLIQNTVKKWTSIPTSVGIGPTKTLSIREKILSKFPIEDIWGIGNGLKGRLNALGIYTASQLKEADPTLIRKKLGVVGERIVWELRGVSCLPMEKAEPRKNIACSRSFGKVVTNLTDLCEAVSTHTARACCKLRKQHSCTQALYVYLEAILDGQTGTRISSNHIIAFPSPTNDTPQVITAAKKCLSFLFRKEARYKKCGVILLDLIPEETVAPDLFIKGSNPKRRELSNTIDALNEKFGKNTVFYGAMGTNPQWKMRSDSRSPGYTTCWEELVLVHA